tara:strand:- start:313689 stop:313991 length:303 start_codon:yes stop_codon:yes gene_type:complete
MDSRRATYRGSGSCSFDQVSTRQFHEFLSQLRSGIGWDHVIIDIVIRIVGGCRMCRLATLSLWRSITAVARHDRRGAALTLFPVDRAIRILVRKTMLFAN